MARAALEREANMLTRLSIRNIVLIEALGLVLGNRADSGLVRSGEDRASVTASFEFSVLPESVRQALDTAEIEVEPGEPLILKRQLRVDGGSKGFINDQPVGVALLRELAPALVEIHGQHDDRGLVNARGHRQLLDRFAQANTGEVATAWRDWRSARDVLEAAQARVAQAAEDRDLLVAFVDELMALAPEAGEEEELALSRATMQKGEKLAEDMADLEHLFHGSDSALASLRGAARRLDRIASEHPLLEEALAALDRAVIEADDAEEKVRAAAEALSFDPAELDRIETRLFELRAAARKHGCQPDDLANKLIDMRATLEAIEGGSEELVRLEAAANAAGQIYRAEAEALHAARIAAALRLDDAVAAELAPLKLDAARFRTAVADMAEDRWGAHGMDTVEFLISTNPGAPFAPLAKIASGGELSRFILALKVALAEEGGAATVIFDEIDRGVGGAVASAIGERLARLASAGQLLAVTHSPQVAARGTRHYMIAKSSEGTVTRTSVTLLDDAERKEEIARMLSGAEVTNEARAQADRLLERA
jgi:DNA repair protein RecN (Recombination protein N)